MFKANKLCRIAKGTYYQSKAGRYGFVPPSQKEIVATLAEPDKGTVGGYWPHNNLKLTKQVAKTIEVFSSQIDQQTKNISNVLLQFCNLVYTPKIKEMSHMLEVLRTFGEI